MVARGGMPAAIIGAAGSKRAALAGRRVRPTAVDVRFDVVGNLDPSTGNNRGSHIGHPRLDQCSRAPASARVLPTPLLPEERVRFAVVAPNDLPKQHVTDPEGVLAGAEFGAVVGVALAVACNEGADLDPAGPLRDAQAPRRDLVGY